MPSILQEGQYAIEFAEFQPNPRVQTDTHTAEKLQMPNRFISFLILKKQQRVNGLVIRKTKHCTEVIECRLYCAARMETQGSPSLLQFAT